MSAELRVVNWNLQWAPRSRRERIAARLAELAPDVLCATEADRGILPAGGHAAECGPDSGYGVKGDRRKVILWSRHPLERIDAAGGPGMPRGRFVAATCLTPEGPLRLVGVCIPWSLAHVTSGGRVPWQDHLAYLGALGPLLARRDPDVPLVVLGDFNQRMPRARAPRSVHDALLTALGDLRVVTCGAIGGIDRPVIDHVAHSGGLAVGDVRGVDRFDGEGKPLSDHDGVVVTLRL